MLRYLILAQSSYTAAALAHWLRFPGLTGARGISEVDPPAGETIVFDVSCLPQEQGVVAYQTLSQRLEELTGINDPGYRSGDTAVLVDTIRSSGLSAIAEDGGWDHIVALLILTYPDIRWIFGIGVSELPGFPAQDHALSTLFEQPRRDPLLDPTGLRDWIRGRTNVALARDVGSGAAPRAQVARRSCLAAAIDEEVDYAYMHAYTTYRYGFRAEIVTSWALMESRFGAVAAAAKQSHGFDLLLEDMRLAFPDKPAAYHLSALQATTDGANRASGRGHHCPLLDDVRDSSRWRFLITTGQTDHDGGPLSENAAYLARKSRGRGAVLYKPVGGICDIWDKTGLLNELGGGSRRGNADGFEWPPSPATEDVGDGHGAPGKLALVANALLRRAMLIRGWATSACDFIRAALLAAEAAEYLGGRTPTLTLSALLLKQECEVLAEGAFVGAGFHFGVERRLAELTHEVNAVCFWFHPARRERSALNARATIVNKLVLSFRQAGQMEEEHACLVEIRKLNRLIATPRTGDLIGWMAHGTLTYGEWLMQSFSRLTIVTGLWVLALAITTALFSEMVGKPQRFEAGSSVISWFFGGNAATNAEPFIRTLSWVAVTAGVFHIGLLISFLYSLISRR